VYRSHYIRELWIFSPIKLVLGPDPRSDGTPEQLTPENSVGSYATDAYRLLEIKIIFTTTESSAAFYQLGFGPHRVRRQEWGYRRS
jgi:hypothetical protein